MKYKIKKHWGFMDRLITTKVYSPTLIEYIMICIFLIVIYFGTR